ncbi:MAG: nitroreductase/quinone reductase family protein [Microthrixaceae bacterium]
MSDGNEMKDWNSKVIEEFRANDGKVGGNFEGAPLLLLHTTGARSGAERINPMMYQDLDDGRIAVFASKAGADTNPDWYHNVVAHPDVTAEIGTDTRDFTARTALADERTPIWEQAEGQTTPASPDTSRRPPARSPSSSSTPAEPVPANRRVVPVPRPIGRGHQAFGAS